MSVDRKENGVVWSKVITIVMGAITLFSTGWAASATTSCWDIKRIDTQGTQKTQSLENRVTKIETILETRLLEFAHRLDKIDQSLQQRALGN